MNIPLPSQIPAAQKRETLDIKAVFDSIDEDFGCFDNMTAIDEAAQKKRHEDKKQFVRQPHLTNRALKDHEGLKALRDSLEVSRAPRPIQAKPVRPKPTRRPRNIVTPTK